MAFSFKKKQGGGGKPALSITLSVKQEQKYIKGPSFGLWTNDAGGPAYRGTLKDKYLTEIVEFLGNAAEADLPVSVALFNNKEQGQAPKSGGFQKKANPFKKQQQEDKTEDPGF